jgi:hypothetical protein
MPRQLRLQATPVKDGSPKMANDRFTSLSPAEASGKSEREPRPDDSNRQDQSDRKVAQGSAERLIEHRPLPLDLLTELLNDMPNSQCGRGEMLTLQPVSGGKAAT